MFHIQIPPHVTAQLQNLQAQPGPGVMQGAAGMQQGSNPSSCMFGSPSRSNQSSMVSSSNNRMAGMLCIHKC